MIPIVITPEDILQDEVQLWEALFLSGLQRLHVRKPHAQLSEIRQMLKQLSAEYRSRIVLHQYHELADEFQLGGIHFKSNVHNGINKQNTNKLSVSRSCHTPLEVLNYHRDYDYIFLSPIFNSISKKGYPAAFYSDEIKTFFQDHPEIRNCVALGGIDKDKIGICKELGFSNCALLGEIWSGNELNPDIISKRFRSLLTHDNTRMKQTAISNFQFITNDFSSLNELEQIRQVCEAGANWIQLRLKNRSDKDIVEMGKQAAEICKQYQATFILNDHIHLIKEIGAHGVHLGKADMCPTEARELLGSEYIIGGTANNMTDVQNLYKANVDYIGLGPFRFTQTKKNLAPVLGLEGYKQIVENCQKDKINIPIVAIGGIEIEDTRNLTQIGLHGIALSSSITSATDISKTTKNYLKQLINPTCKNL